MPLPGLRTIALSCTLEGMTFLIPVALATLVLAQPRTADLGVGAQPPENAAVLIGPAAKNAFNSPEGAFTREQLAALPGYVEVSGGDLVTRASHADCRVHVEWYSPPGGEGQLAGNSGVYLQDLYEVQVLGTMPGDAPLKANEAGAIYGIRASDTNASTGPGTWQAYDIFFRAPRFKDGKKVQPARMTVFWNGTLVHDNVEVPRPTGGGAAARGEQPPPRGEAQVGPLRLQDHETAAQGPVRYRNVWIAPLDPVEYAAGEWQTLFDGKSLEGWSVHGGKATYRVEDGAIVGTTAPDSPNTFLVYRRPFGDFELVLETKQDSELNSGIQFRSAVDGGLENRSGKLIGYQCELDPSERSYTGAVYDEARRGWLYTLTESPEARDAYKRGEWNEIRIVAQGPLIRTWVNGVPATSLFDAMDPTGYIALQVHGVGPRKDPLEVRWRNIRLREFEARRPVDAR